MKRTALARGPWRRKGKKRQPSSYKRRQRFTDYMVWVKSLPCAIALDPCDGVVEADHAGARPMGRKCSDFETIPLCTKHHAQRPGIRGVFEPYDRHEMRNWCDMVIEMIQQQALDVGAPDSEALRVYLAEKPS